MWNTIWNMIQTSVSSFGVLGFALLGCGIFIASSLFLSLRKAHSNSRPSVRVVFHIGLAFMIAGLSFSIIIAIPFFWNIPSRLFGYDFISDPDHVSFWGFLEFALLGCGIFITSFFFFPRKLHSNSRPSVHIISRIGLALMTVGLSFFIITAIPFFWNIPPLPVITNFISDADISGLTITTKWSISQVTHSSTIITVTISPTSLAASPTGTGQTQASLQPTPVGTSNVPIAQAFGADYDVFAEATLDSSAFDISGPQPQSEQSLDQQEVDFTWIVTPKYAGSQVLNVSINGIWSLKGGGKEIKYPLAGHELNVEVTEATPASLLDFGQAVLGGLLVAMAGLIMNLPLAWIMLKKRKEEKRFIALSDQTMPITARGRRTGNSTVADSSNKITLQKAGKALSEEEAISRINIYFSCSSDPRDVKILDGLKRQLSVLQRQPDISFWEKRDILPGADSRQEIFIHISHAHLILFLVSSSFLASDRCYEEMELAVRRMDTEEISLIPLLIDSTAGWEDTPIGKLAPLPPSGQKPIRSQEDREKAMSDIAKHIWRAVEQIRQSLADKGS